MRLFGRAGNMISFGVDAVGYLGRLHDRYGDMASLVRGRSDYVCVFSPRLNQVVLSDPQLFQNLDASSSPVRMQENSALSRLYAGLTNMNGESHQRHRRLMASALPRRHVESYDTAIAELVQQHTAAWRTGDQVDLLTEMRSLTMAVAVRTLLGLDPEREGRQHARLLQDWLDAVFSVPALALPVDAPGLPYHRVQVLSRRLERAVRDIIVFAEGSADDTAVLSRLAQAGSGGGPGLTQDELVGHTAFLFIAGHATTASALTWTLFLLATHPRVGDDLRDELVGCLHGRAPMAAELPALPLLDRVLNESLRILPPVMWWSKVSTAPAQLGRFELRTGTRVIFSPYVTHRLPDVYPTPHHFRPDRWLTANPGPYEYLPFSAGPRSCLGAGFARMEIKLVLAVLLQRWRPLLKPGIRIDRGGVMVSQPKRGLPVTLFPTVGPPARSQVTGNIRRLIDLDDSC